MDAFFVKYDYSVPEYVDSVCIIISMLRLFGMIFQIMKIIPYLSLLKPFEGAHEIYYPGLHRTGTKVTWVKPLAPTGRFGCTRGGLLEHLFDV